MTTKRKVWEDNDVGASKAAKVLLGGLDRSLTKPAGILVRLSGWALIGFAWYMTLFETSGQRDDSSIYTWIQLYIVYMLILELIRRVFSEIYEKQWFRGLRIVVNLVMISILVSIAPAERHFLIFAYTLPIFATIVYFAENIWIKLGVLLLALIGVFTGDILFAYTPRLEPNLLGRYTVVITIFAVGFEILRRRINLGPGRLTEIAKELHKTLDLQGLIIEILANAIDITRAQRGLIIVINPRNKRYVGHILHNFQLKPDRSIENLAEKCFVLAHGKPFESSDLITTFNNKSIYNEFFDVQPHSILAEPLFNRQGQILGVINVARNESNGFDKITKNLLREFAFLISNSIENCFEHREVKLREAKNREVSEKFVSAGSEDEAVHILIEEVRQQIPIAEKITLHQFLPRDEDLLPICSISPETTPGFFIWSKPKSREIKPDLRLGYGIAGHALELRDTILVPNIDIHPWYVKLDGIERIKSLLVAPLFDPEDNELYGTISLESSKFSGFSLDDESTLTYLSIQASRSIAKIKDFQMWREEGGILRKILEEIRSFDISGPESMLCEQIADAATRLLGFKVARIRILSKDERLITVAVSGVASTLKQKLMKVDLPFTRIKPFLNPSFKAESSYLIKYSTPGWKQLVDEYFHRPNQPVHKINDWDPYDALLTPLLDPSGDIIGLLTLDLPVNGSEPTKQILELIGVFANAASWVIELSRFQRQLTEQQYRAQSFIDTISHELAKGRDLPTISEVVVQVGAKILSAEGCSLYLVRGDDLELTHSNFLANTNFISRHKPISSEPKSGLTAWVAATGNVVWFNNEEFKKHPAWAGEEDHLQYLPSKKCISLLMAPIKDKENNIIGVISLENKLTLAGQKDFDEEDKERLVSLANEFARALETIGLYEDIKEWERIGRADDLHDLINWYHSGVIMWIEALEEWLKRDEYKKALELMDELKHHAHTTVFELKALHTDMLTQPLEAKSLKQALEQTMDVWIERTTPKYMGKMYISLECPENLEIPVKIRNTLVRIASLAFSNAIRHSGIIEDPTISVSVIVEQNNDEILLEVADNGKGINEKQKHGGYGLDRMRQLAEKMNNWSNIESTLQIKTGIGRGTKVILCLRNASV